jgi:hypothetical protein
MRQGVAARMLGEALQGCRGELLKRRHQRENTSDTPKDVVSVDVSDAPNASTRTHLGVADRRDEANQRW